MTHNDSATGQFLLMVMAGANRDTTNDMENWFDAFHGFLESSNYLESRLQKHNLQNIFNLLFIPQMRLDPSLENPPEFEALYGYMIEQGKISVDDNGVIKFK
ncbi:hypothetical protein Avbf_03223 [Armadillidium vulgare]|nr:hypothetical protein Avbf_03223 [Armadillidium vulgare]